MSEILEDLKFGRVKSFITKRILTDKSKDIFIERILKRNIDSNVWYDEPLNKYEKLYVAIIPNKPSFLKKCYNDDYKTDIDTAVIVSYMLVKQTEDVYFIDLTETCHKFRGLGINTALINHFKKFYKLEERNKKIVPLYPIPQSVEYWVKYFETNYNIFNKFELQKLRRNFVVSKLDWEYLYEYYDKIYNHFINIRIVEYNKNSIVEMVKKSGLIKSK